MRDLPPGRWEMRGNRRVYVVVTKEDLLADIVPTGPDDTGKEFTWEMWRSFEAAVGRLTEFEKQILALDIHGQSGIAPFLEGATTDKIKKARQKLRAKVIPLLPDGKRQRMESLVEYRTSVMKQPGYLSPSVVVRHRGEGEVSVGGTEGTDEALSRLAHEVTMGKADARRRHKNLAQRLEPVKQKSPMPPKRPRKKAK